MRVPPSLAGVVAAMAVAWPVAARPAPAGPAGLRVDWAVDGAVTGGALASWAALQLARGDLMPASCRWCSPPGVDADVRSALAWSSPGAARTASDALVFTLPAALVGYDLLSTRGGRGGLRASAEDLLVVAEAVALTGLMTDVAKLSFARARPYTLGAAASGGTDRRASFWSEHTSLAFAAAAAGGSVARLRGYPGWGWVYGVGFGAAAATGWLRIASDQHWLTDVVAGAAAGTAIGLLVPWLHRGDGRPGRLSVVVLPSRVVVAGAL